MWKTAFKNFTWSILEYFVPNHARARQCCNFSNTAVPPVHCFDHRDKYFTQKLIWIKNREIIFGDDFPGSTKRSKNQLLMKKSVIHLNLLNIRIEILRRSVKKWGISGLILKIDTLYWILLLYFTHALLV